MQEEAAEKERQEVRTKVDETVVKSEAGQDTEMKDDVGLGKVDAEDSKPAENSSKDTAATKTEDVMDVDTIDLTSPVVSQPEAAPKTIAEEIPPPSAASDLRDMDFDDLFEDLAGTGAAVSVTDANPIPDAIADITTITPLASEVPDVSDVSALLPGLETYANMETSMPAPELATAATTGDQKKKDDPPLADNSASDAAIGDMEALGLVTDNSMFDEAFDFGDFNSGSASAGNDGGANNEDDFMNWYNTSQ
jgi:hypothetical protein